jgi:hypothetical protein
MTGGVRSVVPKSMEDCRIGIVPREAPAACSPEHLATRQVFSEEIFYMQATVTAVRLVALPLFLTC